MKKLSLLIFFASVLSFSVSGAANPNSIRILKNNAIEVNGEKLLLHGIAIPSSTTKCFVNDVAWICGAKATLRLNDVLKQSQISCEFVRNSQNMPLAKCRNAETDIAQILVSEGWAITVHTGKHYLDEELRARNQKLGIWKDGFVPPENWRNYPSLEFEPFSDLLCSVCEARKN